MPAIAGKSLNSDNISYPTSIAFSKAGHGFEGSYTIMLYVRPATITDLKHILYFIDEAADWLRGKGIDQWGSPWPNEEERDARVKRGLHTQRTWMVEDDGIPVATITCRPDANPELWSKPEQTDSAVYLSRLVVSRSYAGYGIGAELIDWAGRWAREQYGARWIRIDVWTTNVALHSYYEKEGFRFLRFCDDVDYPSAALFQKSTDHIGSADIPRLRERPDLIKPSRLGSPASQGSPSIRNRLGAHWQHPSRVSRAHQLAERYYKFGAPHRILARAYAYMPRLTLLRHKKVATRPLDKQR